MNLDRRGDAATESVPSSAPVKIIGASTASVSCAEQTWPYIERRCLTEAPARQGATVTPVTTSADAVPSPAVKTETLPDPSSTKADPDTKPVKTMVVTSAPEPAKDGVNLTETTGAVATSEKAAEAAKSESPAEGKRTSKRQQRREASRADEEARGEPQAKEKTNARRDQREHRMAQPVKRWRELVYDYRDGTRKRVILDGARAASRPLAEVTENDD
jgi:hypothetical protein